MQEQVDNVCKAMETLRKNQNEKPEIRNTIMGIENALDSYISRQDITKESISKLEDT